MNAIFAVLICVGTHCEVQDATYWDYTPYKC